MNCRESTGLFGQRRLSEIWRAGRPELQENLLDRDRRRLFEPERVESAVRFQVFGVRTTLSESRWK